MEDLNKTQVVLLTLFITFVTSVTTGIVTVTLLQQAPPAVTQTINRVVEKTIQTVTPGKTEVKQTIVRQEDEIIQAAATLKPAIARIAIPSGVALGDSSSGQSTDIGSVNNQALVVSANLNPTLTEIGSGFVISSNGLIATSYEIIPEPNSNYTVYVGDKSYTASVVSHSKNNDLTILKINNDSGVKFYVPQFSLDPLALGQTVIVLGRDIERYTVSVGLISSIKEGSTSVIPSFKTTVKSDETNIGGPLVNSSGEIIGLNLSGGNALPVEIIKAYLVGDASTTKAVSGIAN
ncbi:MAG: trypsin-like peptidase domain-containing protein [Candidatus Vogelbacteria bacterium]|nr:trypsin-like peptidase domain-containing protein [Candidatus Vogelbacteria bacterium]